MMLKMPDDRWFDLVAIVGMYNWRSDLESLCHIGYNREIEGFRYGSVSHDLLKRLELPQAELSTLARATGLGWAHRLSASLDWIIAHGEFYPKEKMIRECEEEKSHMESI